MSGNGKESSAPQDASASTASAMNYEPWLEALHAVARHYHIDASQERVRVEAGWMAGTDDPEAVIDHMARQLGLVVMFDDFQPGMLDPWRLPLVADFKNGQVGVLEALGTDGKVSVRLSGDGGLITRLDQHEVAGRVSRVLRVRPQSSAPDVRVDEHIRPHEPNWLWQLVFKQWPRYLDVVLASFIANVLALAGTLFSMQVYDRVIPAQSVPTLWVLFSGLMVALTFAFLMRVLRTHVSDKIGKRADLRISDRVFGHALRIRNDARPKSTGAFVSQLRELEHVREMMTSTTIGAIADLPFFIFFLFVLGLLGGWLVIVPIAAVPLLVIPGLLVQRPLARLAREGMRESALRNAMLVEVVQGMDEIKLLRAEPRFQNQWNHVNEISAGIGMRQRFITGCLTSWTQEVQAMAYACVVLMGAYFAMAGDISTGVMVGCSMLSSRMVAPLGQLSGVMLRWQQARVAREGLDRLMRCPVDQPAQSLRVHRPVLRGQYDLSEVRFWYDRHSDKPVLDIKKLNITPGERIAILGKNGAGKSSLLQLLSGLLAPQEGQILLDQLNLSVIDPIDVRRDMSLLNQNAALFFGSIRDNLVMGMPNASDANLLRAMQLSGASEFINALPGGLDYRLQEAGRGLSGGQRQTLLLARTLLRQANVVLLDEPSAWLDEAAERRLVDSLQNWFKGKTLVVATHRPAVLRWVDRVVVLDGGRVIADGPKEKVLLRPAPTAGRLSPQQSSNEASKGQV